MNRQDYAIGDRWVSNDHRVWEHRKWGWKFLGVAKSYHMLHVMELPCNDCDHPLDVIIEDMDE